jgi:hypothetical protein
MTSSSLGRTILVVVALVTSPQLATAECIVASTAKVRDEPSPDAPVLGTLPIEAVVEVQREGDGWVLVGSELPRGLAPWVELSQSPTGWVRADLVAPKCPTFRDAMEAAKTGEAAARVTWLERAAAMAHSRPERIEAMDALARALERAGAASAGKVRAEVEELRTPIDSRAPKRERVLVLAVVPVDHDQAAVYPLTHPDTYVPLTWASQWGATTFLARYLREGRTYPLLTGGPGGTMTITPDPSFQLRARIALGPGLEDREAECLPFLHARAGIHRNPGEKGRGWIAVAGPVRPTKPGRPLTRAEVKTVTRLARSPFAAASRTAHETVLEETIEEALAAPSAAEGFAKDVDGNGRDELVARVSFRAPGGELHGSVLLVAEQNADGSYTSRVEEGRAGIYGEKAGVELLGIADLGGDGGLELVLLAQDDFHGTSVKIVDLGQGATFFERVVQPGSRCQPWPGDGAEEEVD